MVVQHLAVGCRVHHQVVAYRVHHQVVAYRGHPCLEIEAKAVSPEVMATRLGDKQRVAVAAQTPAHQAESLALGMLLGTMHPSPA